MGDLPRPGEAFGRYHVDGLLGRGGMGVVYLATDTRLKRQVALKVVSAQFADSADFLRRFEREAEVMARVDSPHIVAVHDYGLHEEMPYLVSQYVAGGDLAARLHEHGPLPPKDAVTVTAQVAEALAAAHRAGVVHRDVKPSNVLLRGGGGAPYAYLCDFGVAQPGDADALTQTGGVVGSWGYLAPERVNGKPATPATDVYAAGCLLWACLTGQQPYGGTDIEIAMAHLNAPVPRLAGSDPLSVRLNEVLGRSMAKSPEGRYATAEELRDALAGVAGLEGPSHVAPVPTAAAVAAGETVVRTPGPRRRRTPSAKVVAGVVAAAVVLAAGGTWWAVARDGGGAKPAHADAPKRAVRGDLDGDGKGDLLGWQERRSTTSKIDTVTWRSTGDGLDAPQSSHRTENYMYVYVTDVDGDGRDDQVRVDPGEDDDYTVTVTPAKGTPWSTKVAVPEAVFGFFPDLNVADVDGDGRADLFVRGNQNGRESFYVGLAGDRTFAKPTPWLTTRSDPNAGIDFIYPGDFDGDGKQDILWAIDVGKKKTALRVLTSTGTSFTTVADPLVITEPAWLAGLAVGLVYPGDFDGDGADEVLVGGGRGHAFGIAEVAGGRLTGLRVVLKDLGRGPLPDWHDATLSDVDGDGDDDLVTLLDPKDESRVIEVYRADGDKLTGPEVWGSWACGSVCGDDFNLAFTS